MGNDNVVIVTGAILESEKDVSISYTVRGRW